MKALERPKTDRIPRQVSAEEGAKEPRRIPSKRREAAILRRRAVAVLALALVIAMAAGWALFQKGAVVKSPFDFSQPRWKDESATHFTFAAAGGVGGLDNNDSVGVLGRARTAGMSSFRALGELAYGTRAARWQPPRK